MNSFVRYQLPAILFGLLIFTGSSIPSVSPPVGFQLSDKLYHFAEYCMFGYLCARAFYFQKNLVLRDFALIIALVVGSLYAVLDELHQSFIPGRYAEVGDFVADVLGVILSVVVFAHRERLLAGVGLHRFKKKPTARPRSSKARSASSAPAGSGLHKSEAGQKTR